MSTLRPADRPANIPADIPAKTADAADQLTVNHLQVTGVSHRFGSIVAADDVHLEVDAGEVHCLLGPSGSGKSTLLRLIAGLETLQVGAISIGGQTVAGPGVHLAPEKRAVGFVFQDYALFPHLDARHNVAFGLEQGSRRQRLQEADRWLDKVGLLGHARAMPHTLSGGQQQRVALVRALARGPGVMLLDEPFSGLDQRLRAEVRGMTLELLRRSGVATLMITHDPREALRSGDRVSVIRDGRLLQTGTPEAVYRRSSHRRVAEIFGPVNVWPARAAGGAASTPWGDLPSGADGDVEVLIRPDALVLSRADAAPGGPTAHGPTAGGQILEVQTAGALATVWIEVAGIRLQAQDFARRGWRPGESVRVALDGEVSVLPVDPA